MKKVEYLITSKLSNISLDELKSLRSEYYALLRANPFPIPPTSGNILEMISYFKRKDENKPTCIGPYNNISVFEAANRIGSDLVILNGIIQLINEKKLDVEEFTLRLGSTHKKGKGDFTLKIKSDEFEGEAFNVSPTFLSTKLRATIKKWANDNSLKYILINEEAFEFFTKIPESRIFKVCNWNKEL